MQEQTTVGYTVALGVLSLNLVAIPNTYIVVEFTFSSSVGIRDEKISKRVKNASKFR